MTMNSSSRETYAETYFTEEESFPMESETILQSPNTIGSSKTALVLGLLPVFLLFFIITVCKITSKLLAKPSPEQLKDSFLTETTCSTLSSTADYSSMLPKRHRDGPKFQFAVHTHQP